MRTAQTAFRLLSGVFVLTLVASVPSAPAESSAYTQHPRGIRPRESTEAEAKFFGQLRRIFGRFRHQDLEQAFQAAQPILCTELLSDNGKWREVGFFNENRGLGSWFRSSMAEVRSQLDVYTFEGACERQESSLQVTTQFPVDQSLMAYRRGQIPFRDIEVKINAPVSATFERQTQAYTFDLPYLFRVSNANVDPLYALSPRTLLDQYAPEAINRWQCKAVTAEDVTYQFLICRTSLLLRTAPNSLDNTRSLYGASAFSILTDGQEASASVKLEF
jgi:hypothetical protein